VHRLVASKAREAGRILNIRVQVRTFDVMCQMIQHQLGIGILPEMALQPIASALKLKLIALDEPWARRDIDVVVPARDAIAPPTERLLQRLRVTAGFS
jgi:DNA-binding transcriptional LysR family regulator